MRRYVLSRQLEDGTMRPVTNTELKLVRVAHGLQSPECSPHAALELPGAVTTKLQVVLFQQAAS